jgi:hypothetical protein
VAIENIRAFSLTAMRKRRQVRPPGRRLAGHRPGALEGEPTGTAHVAWRPSFRGRQAIGCAFAAESGEPSVQRLHRISGTLA